ncbi:hypothetical protein KDD17_02100 [Sulfitobacter albidus]|uniref:Lipoprotein n=1 Tax=Sulfitobacter albidus TaxID=2829501 RepID=A0A975JE86_9RHOB|nr:hypothetical protein [Sulfitobacter albidus]QUJ76876.1 hypothetical protein KDD17_02100 [Sulfitobacter albidus]
MTRFLILCAVLTLAACGGAQNADGVRNGPQAVHPASQAPGAAPCGAEGQPACT